MGNFFSCVGKIKNSAREVYEVSHEDVPVASLHSLSSIETVEDKVVERVCSYVTCDHPSYTGVQVLKKVNVNVVSRDTLDTTCSSPYSIESVERLTCDTLDNISCCTYTEDCKEVDHVIEKVEKLNVGELFEEVYPDVTDASVVSNISFAKKNKIQKNNKENEAERLCREEQEMLDVKLKQQELTIQDFSDDENNHVQSAASVLQLVSQTSTILQPASLTVMEESGRSCSVQKKAQNQRNNLSSVKNISVKKVLSNRGPIQGHFRNVLLNETAAYVPVNNGKLLQSFPVSNGSLLYSDGLQRTASNIRRVSPLVLSDGSNGSTNRYQRTKTKSNVCSSNSSASKYQVTQCKGILRPSGSSWRNENDCIPPIMKEAPDVRSSNKDTLGVNFSNKDTLGVRFSDNLHNDNLRNDNLRNDNLRNGNDNLRNDMLKKDLLLSDHVSMNKIGEFLDTRDHIDKSEFDAVVRNLVDQTTNVFPEAQSKIPLCGTKQVIGPFMHEAISSSHEPRSLAASRFPVIASIDRKRRSKQSNYSITSNKKSSNFTVSSCYRDINSSFLPVIPPLRQQCHVNEDPNKRSAASIPFSNNSIISLKSQRSGITDRVTASSGSENYDGCKRTGSYNQTLPSLGEEPINAAAIISCFHGNIDNDTTLPEVNAVENSFNVLKQLPPISTVPLVTKRSTRNKEIEDKIKFMSKYGSKKEVRFTLTSEPCVQDGTMCKHDTTRKACRICTRPPSRGGRVLMEWLKKKNADSKL